MFELANTDLDDKQLLRKQMMLVWRAQKTLILRFGGLVLGLELTTLKWARLVMQKPSLTLADFRKIRLATLTSSLMAVSIAYPSLSMVGRQVELVPQPRLVEVFPHSADYAKGSTCLVYEQAEHGIPGISQQLEQRLWPDAISYSDDAYEPDACFWSDDIVANFCANIGQLMAKWWDEFIAWIHQPKTASQLSEITPIHFAYRYQPQNPEASSPELSKSRSPCLASDCGNSSTTDWIKSSIKNRIKF